MASKKELLEETKQVETAIVAQVQEIQEMVWQKVKIGLTMAFIGFGTYWLVKRYLDYPARYQDLMPQQSENAEKENSNIVNPNQEPDIIQMIKKEIAVFLLAIAKQKIQELLQKLYDTENMEEEEELSEENN